MASMSTALGVPAPDMLAALKNYDETRIHDQIARDSFRCMPHDVLSEFGISIPTALKAFIGASYFHGTRAAQPEAFADQGILPLGDALDGIWSYLRVLAGADITDSEWVSFRESLACGAGEDDGFLFRHKTADLSMWGPHGMLVKETLLSPIEAGIHDYLNGPEIIEDITHAIEVEYQIPLLDRFVATTRPCIVEFRSSSLGVDEIQSAIWYLYSRTRKQQLSNVIQGGFAGNGKPVPSHHVVAVEVVDNRRLGS